MKTLGIILIVAGIGMMVFTGFNLITKKKVLDIGPVEINKEEKIPINWLPIVGVILLVSGIAITVMAKNKN